MRSRLSALLGTLKAMSLREHLLLGCFITIAFTGSILVTFIARHAISIHGITRGVGDTVFYSAEGRPWFRMDEQRRDVPLSQIAGDLQNAIVAVEDHRFRWHPGVDPIGIARATVRNLRAPGTIEGGSTISQQLARTLFLTNTRTYNRKIKEAILALILEAQLSKRQILELYVNRIYLSAGVYGVEPMSRRLFAKPAKELSLPEAALVAGLIRAPSSLSPWSNLDGAVRRSHVVLDQMRAHGYITAEEESRAKRTRVRVRPYTTSVDARGGYAKEFLRQQFQTHFGGDHPPDWQVHTTFVLGLQDAAEQAVNWGLRRWPSRDLQAALVALDPQTGDVLAMVGGRDFKTTTFNRAVRSRRQPGSAFKPFVYAAALDRGFSPVSVLTGLDAIKPQGPDEWTPRNATYESPEALAIRTAIIVSDNRAAVRLQQEVGSRAVLLLAEDAGLTELPDVPSLALGTGVVTPLDLTAAYTAFPGGGYAARPRAIVRVLDADRQPALDEDVSRTRVMSPEAAYQMVSLLADVVDRGTATSARTFGLTGPVAGKTGTTDDFKDAWFVGFSSSVVAGVWVGHDTPARIGRDAYAARVALPIWSEFMRRAGSIRPMRPFARPAGLRAETLCRVSYLRPVEECPTYVEYFKRGDDVPSAECRVHRVPFGEKAKRVVEDLLEEVGRKLWGIIKR